MQNSKTQFIRSLGYLDPHPDDHLYSALMLQPRMVGVVTVIGVLLSTEAWIIAWVLEALMAVAVAGVVFKRSCAGAELYLALCRRWSNGECIPAAQQR